MVETETPPNLALLPIGPGHKILVTGGNGFIGSHVAKALTDLGAFVRVADIVPSSAFDEPICDETLVGNEGKRSYHRFYMWSKGDGGLVKLYPDLTYIDHAPNSGELLLISCVLECIGVPFFLLTDIAFPSVFALHVATMTIIGNMIHDMYRHLWRDVSRAATINSTLVGPKWIMAVAESSLIRVASEWGRVVGMLE